MTPSGQGALSGLRVLDCSRFIAGPYCGMLLGDLGADVVKVERSQGGDEARSFGPAIAGETLYVRVYNRNKRSVTIDFRHAEGPALLRDLAARADVLIENFRPGVMEASAVDQGPLGWSAPQRVQKEGEMLTFLPLKGIARRSKTREEISICSYRSF